MFSAKNYNDTIKFESRGRGHGFFSNWSFVLTSIVKFVIENKKLPVYLDTSLMCPLYKADPNDAVKDFMKECFEQKCILDLRINIDPTVSRRLFNQGSHELPYKDLRFNKLNLYIDTYFTPSTNIKEIINTIEKTYLINYENTCTVYYRGTDKSREAGLASYEEFFDKAEEILQKNPKIRFFLQTDELEFAAAFKQRFNNSFSINELAMISRENKQGPHGSLLKSERTTHVNWFLAAVIIMSKTTHIITSSGNAALWVVLYRGNCKNVHQYLHRINRFTQETVQNFGWI